MKKNYIRSKMNKKAIAALMAIMIMSAPVTNVTFAAEGPGAEPEKPVVTSYEDNDKIEAYNKKVDDYNASAKQYNEAVDKEYNDAVAANNKIDEENALEEARVKEHNDNEDAKAKASAEARKAAEDWNEASKAHNEAVAKYAEDKAK